MPSLPTGSSADPTADGSGAVNSVRTRAELPPGLARAALTGDPVAVSMLLGWIRPAMVRYCRARITPRSGHGGVDDVAQDICAAVLHSLPSFVGGPEEVLRWVYGIAAHKVVDYHRRSGRDQSEPTDQAPRQVDPRAGPEEPAMRGEERTVMLALLATLTPVQQEVLTLRVIIGLSSADTAAITGLSATSVRVTQHRALNRLRQQLNRPPGER